ncbi:hypothetical protein BSKO_10829 [Bryopsis sp. KO-2023]|nr:hypothetical protein BSKO_10829 [Bryopsis sp. KO-2023]
MDSLPNEGPANASFSECKSESESESEGSGMILSQWHAHFDCEGDDPDFLKSSEEAMDGLAKEEAEFSHPRGNLAASSCLEEFAGEGFSLDFECEDVKALGKGRGEILDSDVGLKSTSLHAPPDFTPLAARKVPNCRSEAVESMEPAPPLKNSHKAVEERKDVGISCSNRSNTGPVISEKGKENVSQAVDSCVFCGLDLSGMLLEEKTQHVNRCCDGAEGLFEGKLHGGDVMAAKVSVEAFLRELKLEKYLDVFIACRFDIDSLLEVTDAKLLQMGLPLGPRKKVLIGAAVLKSSGIRSHKDTLSTRKRKEQSRINDSNIRKRFRRFKAAPENQNDIGISQQRGDALQVLMKNAKEGIPATPTPINFREMELRAVGGLYEIMEIESALQTGASVQRFVDMWGAEQPSPTNRPAPLFQLHYSESPISCPLREPLTSTKQQLRAPENKGQPEKPTSANLPPLNGEKKGDQGGLTSGKKGRESLGVKLVKLKALREELRLLEQSVCSIKASIRCVEEEIEEEKSMEGYPR